MVQREAATVERVIHDRNLTAWAALVHHRTHRGKSLDFIRNPFLRQVYNDQSPYISLMKSTQAGVTEWLICYAITQAIQGMSVFYVLPDLNLIGRFVRNRVDTVVERTSFYKKSIHAIQGKASEAMTLKHFGGGVIAFVGSNSKAAFTEFPADIAIVDELNECDPDNIEMVPERLSHSDYRWEIKVGNPTIPEFGISKEFDESCRFRWFIDCPHCGTEINPDFFVHVVNEVGPGVYRVLDNEYDPDGLEDARLICHACGKPVDRRESDPWKCRWVAEFPGRRHGYHMNKLFSGNVLIRELLDRLERGTKSDAALIRFYNGDLGLPFVAKGSFIDQDSLDVCREQYLMAVPKSGYNVIGVDVGNVFHVLVGNVDFHSERLRLVHAESVENLRELMRIIRDFRPVAGVIDALPEKRIAKMVCGRVPGMFMCFFGEVKRDLIQGKILTVDRTAAIDQAKEAVMSRYLALPANARDVPELYYQIGNSTRLFDQKANHGLGAYHWVEGTRPDHYLLALTYMVLARNIAIRVSARKRIVVNPGGGNGNDGADS